MAVFDLTILHLRIGTPLKGSAKGMFTLSRAGLLQASPRIRDTEDSTEDLESPLPTGVIPSDLCEVGVEA
jgi:hypothetical protein